MEKLIAMVICTILEDGMVVVLIDNEWIEFKAK